MRSGNVRDGLSRTLRALRVTAQLSQAQSGEHTEIGQRKVSRFENGLYVPTVAELDALLRVYEAPDDAAGRLREIVGILRAEVRKPRAGIRRGNIASIQHQMSRIEATAELTESFHPSIVLGLLQSPAYVRAVFGVDGVTDAEDAVEARLARQRQMMESGKRFTLIQSEGALRWNLGSPGVMAEQLDMIAELATRSSNVRIGIIPWTRSAPVTVVNGFGLFDRRVVLVGTISGTTILHYETDLDDYRELFDELQNLAVFDAEAAELACRIADDYRQLGSQDGESVVSAR